MPREFHTIAVDDGIAMGHGGMLYSLPSREVIADAVEYMVNGHAADALVCISNCDKITPGHAQRRHAAQHPHGLRLRRSDGGRQGRRRRRRRAGPDRPDHRDLRLGVVPGRRRRAHRGRALRLPDLRVVLRHVHRQLDELPDRGARAGPAGQRLDAGHARRAPRAVPARPGARSWTWPPLVRPRRRLGAAPQHRHARRVRERDGARRRHGRLHEHGAAHPGRRAGRRDRLRPGRHRRRLPTGPLPGQGGAELRLPHGGRAPRRWHPRHPRRAVAGRPAEGRRAHRALPLARGVAVGVGRPRPRHRRRPPSSCSTRRRAASARPRRSRRRTAGRRSTPTPPRAASTTWRTPTRSRAAWPCCAATSPPTARSSSPRASPRSCGTSRARRGSSRARSRPSRSSSASRCSPATCW